MNITLDEGAIAPTKGTVLSAGWDLYSREDCIVPVGERQFFDTGVHIQLEAGMYGIVCNRSGLAKKRAVETVLGIIDADYRGSIGVTIKNLGNEPFIVHKGDRISQLVITMMPICRAELYVVDKLADSERGSGGFGSTGV